MWSMAKQKVTITLDREKADEARRLLAADSTSEVIDVALKRLIKAERLREDIQAYQRTPLTEEEMGIADVGDMSDLEDDADWEALYKDVLDG